jgi:hypothetical protein
MMDGSVNPFELTIDTETGIFSLINDATIKQTYEVQIYIRTTDSSVANRIDLTVSDFTIAITCGPNSTTLTPPVITALRKASVENRELIVRDT